MTSSACLKCEVVRADPKPSLPNASLESSINDGYGLPQALHGKLQLKAINGWQKCHAVASVALPTEFRGIGWQGLPSFCHPDCQR